MIGENDDHNFRGMFPVKLWLQLQNHRDDQMQFRPSSFTALKAVSGLRDLADRQSLSPARAFLQTPNR
jgi:hypothetical protein